MTSFVGREVGFMAMLSYIVYMFVNMFARLRGVHVMMSRRVMQT